MEKKIPLIFSSNNYFVPYMSVMIASIIEQAADENCYEIIVLHRDISDAYQSLLRDQVMQKSNFSLRLIDVSKEVGQYSFYTENRMFFTAEAYYRLLAPFLLPEYDWAVYMDGDMVALTDIADLAQIKLEGLLIAAVRDFCGISDVFDPESDRRDYMENSLKLKNYEDYYVSGLLVINLAEFRRQFSLRQIMELACARQWRYHDQDILNVLTEGKTLLLDPRWNVLQDYGMHRLMPRRYYQEWKASQDDPYIVHYGGDSKPWRFPRVPRASFFWKYAKNSPFYDEILARGKRERRENGYYRLKYYLQFLFPTGSRSRIFVKKCTKPIWSAVKRRYHGT